MAKILKILSGTHLGAQAELPAQGDVTIGRGDGCVLIVDDLLAVEEHVRLVTGPGPDAVTVAFLSPGFLGERPAPAGHQQNLGDGDVVTFGATQFCVGPSDKPWGAVRFPDWKKMQANAAESAAKTVSATAEEAAGTPDAKSRAEALPEGAPPGEPTGAEMASVAAASTSSPPPPAEGAAKPEASASRFRGKRRRGIFAGIVALLVVAALAPVGYFYWRSGSAGISAQARILPVGLQDEESLKGRIRSVTSRYRLTSSRENGHWVISGVVNDQKTMDLVNHDLQPASNVELRITSAEQILRSAQAVVRGFGYPITVAAGTDGALKLNGSVPDEDDMQRVLSRLESDVRGARRFDVDVEYISKVSDSLTSAVTAMGLRRVKMELNNGTLHAMGIVPEAKSLAWQQKLASWKKQYQSIREIDDKTVVETSPPPETPKPVAVAQAEESTHPLSSPIASIRLQPLPSFQTRDGQVFFAKASLANGYLVDGIELNGIWIRPVEGTAEDRRWVALGQSKPDVKN